HLVLLEEVIEQLAAQRRISGQAIGVAVISEQHRAQRLRRRSGQDFGAARRVVLAMVRTAVDQLVLYAALGPGSAKADEAHVARRVDQLVRADGAIGNDALIDSDATGPEIGIASFRAQGARRRRFAQIEQEHRRGLERIVEKVVDLGFETRRLERIAVFVDQQRRCIGVGFGIRRQRREWCGSRDERRGGRARLDETAPVHLCRKYRQASRLSKGFLPNTKVAMVRCALRPHSSRSRMTAIRGHRWLAGHPSHVRLRGRRKEITMSISMILLILLILLLVGALPTWGHSRNWGYGPSGGLGLVVLILVVLLLLGKI